MASARGDGRALALARVVDGFRAELAGDEPAGRVVCHDADVAGRDGRLDDVAEHRQGDVGPELGR